MILCAVIAGLLFFFIILTDFKKKSHFTFPVFFIIFLLSFYLHYKGNELLGESTSVITYLNFGFKSLNMFTGTFDSSVYKIIFESTPNFLWMYTAVQIVSYVFSIKMVIRIFRFRINNFWRNVNPCFKEQYFLVGSKSKISAFCDSSVSLKKTKITIISHDFSLEEVMDYKVKVSLKKRNWIRIIDDVVDKKKNYKVISFFDEQSEMLKLIKEIVKLTEEEKNIAGYIDVNDTTKLTYLDTFNEKYSNLNLFSLNELSAIECISNWPLTLLAKDEINNKELRFSTNRVSINFIGIGDTNLQLLKYSIINNQMKNSVLTYHVFDKDVNNSEYELGKVLRRIPDLDVFGRKLQPIANIKYDNLSIKSKKFYYAIEKKLVSKGVNVFYISLGSSDNNINVALELKEVIKNQGINSKSYIFVKLDKLENLDIYNDNKNIQLITYGSYNSIITKQIIVNETLDSISQGINQSYDESAKWQTTIPYNKRSSRSSALNIKHKLNLLGYDLVEGKNGISENDFYSNITETQKKNLANQEHLRWNAFMFFEGFDPMSKESFIESKRTKDKIKYEHLSLVSDESLVDLSKLLISQTGTDDNVIEKDLDLYYDLFRILGNTNYTVKKQ